VQAAESGDADALVLSRVVTLSKLPWPEKTNGRNVDGMEHRSMFSG
jgi:hypothetical protein